MPLVFEPPFLLFIPEGQVKRKSKFKGSKSGNNPEHTRLILHRKPKLTPLDDSIHKNEHYERVVGQSAIDEIIHFFSNEHGFVAQSIVDARNNC